ncbi:MAG: spore maturation protein [Gammaproteobacteria bacterium]|nr:spore maturation protein [Gammaproteobacteria bacterium]
MLNAIWVGFFLVAFVTALAKWLFLGQGDVFVQMMQATFDTSKTAFQIALGLTGVMALWLGIMRIGERAGFLRLLTRALTPLFARLFPEVPRDHPALGAMVMNVAANMMGLDNAATPLGLKAMRELQTLNPSTDTASNAQILFLVLNSASVTLLPVTIFTYRAQLGAIDPTDVFIPILIATYASAMTGLVAVAVVQKLNLLDRVVLLYLGSITVLVAGLVLYFARLGPAQMQRQSAFISNFLLFLVIIAFIAGAAIKKVNVYEAFIEGAKDGFQVAVGIIPYLVAMLVAIGVFRASGALDVLMGAIRRLVDALGINDRFVAGLPTALMKPLSGSGARAMMIETMKTYGPDSFAGRLASVIQGSTETTFYVLAVYLGSVGIRRGRHAVACGLLADLGGIVTAILVSYLFFG